MLLGSVVVLLVLPLDALYGVGPGWDAPGLNQVQALTGHLAFQADVWRVPPLETERLFWPRGISLGLVDSNALVSLLAKLWTQAAGSAPVNWLGGFLGACWLLQPVAAVYAARGLGVRPWAALVAGVLACAWPALMFQMTHITLCGHFLILAALGMTFRRIERACSWAPPAVLLLVSVLTQPYLFQLCAAVLAAVPLHAALRRRARWQREVGFYLLSGLVAVGAWVLLGGSFGAGGEGFGVFSMNLGSPIWPQLSGVFGPSLPILDATGGQHEGFNWLGAGTLLLLVTAVVAAGVRRTWPRPALALVAVLAGLTLLSLSSRVYAGPVKLIDLGSRPWEVVFGAFRASGRAFWPVGYALMLAGVAGANRLPRRIAVAVLLAAAVLQVIDIRPLLHAARTSWVQGSGVAVPPLPVGATLFTMVPSPNCSPDPAANVAGPIMLLNAVRQGARIGDVGLGRSPEWFSCEAIVSDALELPLLPREVRAYAGHDIQAALRPALLGPGAVCRRSSGLSGLPSDSPAVVQCGRDIASFAGEPIPAAAMPPPVTLPYEVQRAGLKAVLAFGWRHDPGGAAISDGPRSSLLIPVVPGHGLELRLRAAGVAFQAGEARVVRVSSGRLPVGEFSLPDGIETEVVVAIPPSTIADGMMRVSLDVESPVRPSWRGRAASATRAGIVLSGVSLQAE